nr:FAD-binding protein [uncultured Brevundimonas sp.]
MGVRDSVDLAWSDWKASAGWDRFDGDLRADVWARRWGQAYVEFATGEKRDWLRRRGVRLTPMVGWAERGDGRAGGHGNSVPRFHVAWGTGTGVSGPFAQRALAAERRGAQDPP